MPQVATKAYWSDRWGIFRSRMAISRNHYKVNPGLYAVGTPGADAPILVTANYKLSFDTLRFQLEGINAWLLVVDTRGINVWCAAGKDTFSTAEIICSVKKYRAAELVDTPQLIMPQLGATGVSALAVKKGCGFSVLFGPIRATDLPAYLRNGNQADEAMRSVSFSLGERAVLIPVELVLISKPFALISIALFLLSGFGPEFYSISTAYRRGVLLLLAGMTGLFCGAILTPILLPWLPGRQFWLKGVWPGLVIGSLVTWQTLASPLSPEGIALLIWTTVVSSYVAMNFTGATPFTSLAGVEYEIRRGLPLQIGATAVSLILWFINPFLA